MTQKSKQRIYKVKKSNEMDYRREEFDMRRNGVNEKDHAASRDDDNSLRTSRSELKLESLTRQMSQSNIASKGEPKSPYSPIAQQIRKFVSQDTACKLGCGGEKCKFCTSNWPQEDMAIKGLFSHWVTDDILAMARPTTRLIKEGLVDEMKKTGITAIFNLQMMNEHRFCGQKLESSGFSYDPVEFTKKNIFYYNFGFEDYSIASTPKLIDMVKVFQFSLNGKGKVAIHCHAGLGRTGLFIACYLIYTFRISAKDAIHLIRDKRKKAVQMDDQINAIKAFEKFISPLRIIYPSIADFHTKLTLTSFIYTQRYFLHGYESRTLKYIPKIIYVCCERLRKLINDNEKINNNNHNGNVKSSTKNSHLADQIRELSQSYVTNIIGEAQKKIGSNFINALCSDTFSKSVMARMEEYQRNINKNDEVIDSLYDEKDVFVLVALMWSWLDQLDLPVLQEQDMNLLFRNTVQDEYGEIEFKWDHLDRATYKTVDCIMNIYRDLYNKSTELFTENEEPLLIMLMRILTQSSIPTHNHNDKSDSDDETNSRNQVLIKHSNYLKKQNIVYLFTALIQFIKRHDTTKSTTSLNPSSSSTDDDDLRRNHLMKTNFTVD